MPPRWHSFPSLLLAIFSLYITFNASTVAAQSGGTSSSFENTAIVRTAELGGSIVHVTTTYAIKSLAPDQEVYTVAFPRHERDKTSWVEVTVKGQKDALDIMERPYYVNAKFTLLDVQLPKKLGTNATLNLVVETIQTHMTEPWPAYAAQKDEQVMRYSTDLFVLSPYPTLVQRTKIKAINPRIVSYNTPSTSHVGAFISSPKEKYATKSGATVTYGPFNNIPVSAKDQFLDDHQETVTVRYHHEQPVVEVTSYKREVEISHWGANVNTQDEIVLYNAGPKLKGHFSRVDYQQSSYFGKPLPHILHAMTLFLPAGINNVYYYDQIGNVSTSRLRVAPPLPKGHLPHRDLSTLEMRPRYPLLGGWNYSFTLGWDAGLEGVAGYNKTSGTYTVEVPVMTPIPGAVVDDLQLKIILPEGATDIEVTTPFPSRAMWLDTHTTYLDTIGRPAVMFEYKGLTVKHAQNIYVTYKLSAAAHLRKPVAVSAVFFGLFLFALVVQRVDLTIHKKKST